MITALTVMLVLLVMAVPSGAKPTGAFEFSGKASLNGGFPCPAGCSGTFSGKALGNTINAPKVKCTKACAMTASFTYKEPGGFCVVTVPAAAIGSATGSYTITSTTGSFTGNFAWTRVGVNAVMILSGPTGVGLAGFVPPAKCTPSTATVAGVASTV